MKITAIRVISLIFVICLCLYDCYGQVAVRPKDLNEAIEYFNKTWTIKQKDEFRSKTEQDAVTDLHYSVGLWIRNNWIHGDRDKSLNNYFHKLGVPSVDDVSSIILTSLHRKLNNKPINLQKQVDQSKAAWKPVVDCKKQAKKQAIATYKKFEIGDPITILMYVDISSNGDRNAVTFACPTVDWKFNPKKDLTLKGMVTDKYTINSDSNVFFKVKIQKMSSPNTMIFLNQIKIGDTESFSLENLFVK
ncbi:MAG TPA: DUF6794 domain-containing protein [Mucilaginibacter sp.]|nr:DUF6794 domain-containing protein [Mucilaginibacter sp.]